MSSDINMKTKNAILFCSMIIVLLISILLSLSAGRYPLSAAIIVKMIIGKIGLFPFTDDSAVSTILFNVRIPRVFSAVLAGMALSGAGACYQSIFRNPMVDSSLLGVTAGASLGAAAGILFGFGIIAIQITAFISGLAAVFLTILLSSIVNRRNDSVLTLVLSGIVTGTLLSSCLSLVKYVADPYSRLPAITYWLMGSLASVNPADARIAAVTTIAGIIPMIFLRWKVDVLSFGDEEARTLGVNVRLIRYTLIASSTLLTASVISIAGMIGWIGLVVPHLSRMIVGPSFKVLLPFTLLLGGTYLLCVDTLSRVIFPLEIPIGILTSIIGAPFFIILLVKGKRGWV